MLTADSIIVTRNKHLGCNVSKRALLCILLFSCVFENGQVAFCVISHMIKNVDLHEERAPDLSRRVLFELVLLHAAFVKRQACTAMKESHSARESR